MRSQQQSKTSLPQALGIVAFFAIFGLLGCNGISTKGGSSGCTTTTAQINVYDGAMSRVCGCTEGTGTFSTSGSLNCTVTLGSTIYFSFIGLGSNPHRITYQYGSTPTFDQNSTTTTAALVMTSSGTFSFSDLNGIGGNFIVTP